MSPGLSCALPPQAFGTRPVKRRVWTSANGLRTHALTMGQGPGRAPATLLEHLPSVRPVRPFPSHP